MACTDNEPFMCLTVSTNGLHADPSECYYYNFAPSAVGLAIPTFYYNPWDPWGSMPDMRCRARAQQDVTCDVRFDSGWYGPSGRLLCHCSPLPGGEEGSPEESRGEELKPLGTIRTNAREPAA